jgi:hypothetical protein
MKHVRFLWAVQGVFEQVCPPWLFSVGNVVVFEVDLQTGPRVPEEAPEIRWATPEDVEMLSVSGQSPDVMEDRLSRGGAAVYWAHNGELLGYRWYGTVEHEEHDWLRFVLADDEVWGLDSWVSPQHRGRGIIGRIRGLGNSRFAQSGYTRVLCAVDALNRSSVRAAVKEGSELVGRIVFVRVLGFTIARIGTSLRVGRWGPRRRLAVSRTMIRGSGQTAN